MAGDTGRSHGVVRVPRVDPAANVRPRLNRAIRSVAPGTCLVVSAPPGYGATTAVTHALTHLKGPVAWLTVDGSDASAAWPVVGARVARAWKDDGLRDLPARELAQSLSHAGDGWIVIDGLDHDLHPELCADARALATSLPANVRLAVITRRRSLDLGSSPGSAARLGASALAFEPDETVEMLLRAAPEIEPHEIADVVAATDGWAAGIASAARHACVDPRFSPSAWLESDAPEELLGAWLDALPGSIRAFLLDTAVLDALAPQLCDEVTGRDGSEESLSWLRDHNGFLRPADMHGAYGYQRHPLLSSLLRRRTWGTDLSHAHRAAGAWLAATGDQAGAVRHLIDGGLLQEAVAVIRDREDAMFERGDSEQMLAWYSHLPEGALGGDLEELLRLGWARALSGDRAGAHFVAEQLTVRLTALDEPDPRGEEGNSLWGEVALLRAYVALQAGDPSAAADAARRASDAFLGEVQRNAPQLAPILLVRALLMAGDLTAARRELDKLSTAALRSDMIRESALGGAQALTSVLEGRVRDARARVERASQWHLTQHVDPVQGRMFSTPLAGAWVELESGRCEDAQAAFRLIADTALSYGNVGEGVLALAGQARAQFAGGSPAGALRTLADARATLMRSSPGSRLGVVLARSEARVRIAIGDVVRADRIVNALPPGHDRTLLWSWLSVHRNAASVERTLSAVQPQTPRVAVETQVLLAASVIRRSSRLAEAFLMRAADIADDQGMELALLGVSEDLLDLAQAAARHHAHDALLRLATIARTSRTEPEASRATVTSSPAPLSAGELELIALLPGRASVAGIAKALGVSPNTVKTRLQRLYRKIGAHSRDDAIAIARARGLLT